MRECVVALGPNAMLLYVHTAGSLVLPLSVTDATPAGNVAGGMGDVSVKMGAAVSSNVAVTDFAASIVTEQVPVPVHAPDQPVNEKPLFGVATNVTAVPLTKKAEQAPGQLMPAGDEVTVPVPVPAVVTARAWEGRLNVAVTVLFAVIVNVHVVAALTHAPENPAKVEPPEGVAVRVMSVPLTYGPVGGLTAIVPVPVPAVVTTRA